MSASKVLDEVFTALQSVGDKPTLSATNKAYIKAVTIMEQALLAEYTKGRREAIQEIENENIKKQKNQN